MPLIFVKPQNLLDMDADALVNTVNCVGFMGKGVAKAFAQDGRFQREISKNETIGLEVDYKVRCESREVRPGEPYVWVRESLGGFPQPLGGPRFVINLPTKNHYANPSRIEWVERGLARFRQLIDEYQIKSIAMPAPGCGNGGLEWSAVKSAIERNLGNIAIPIIVVEPEQTPTHGFIER